MHRIAAHHRELPMSIVLQSPGQRPPQGGGNLAIISSWCLNLLQRNLLLISFICSTYQLETLNKLLSYVPISSFVMGLIILNTYLHLVAGGENEVIQERCLEECLTHHQFSAVRYPSLLVISTLELS